ncbi:hypothetical protein NL676_015048 [Syzygium grande]|nr:hypothetical protein NL676_015048 [Syzygium grande]
MASSTSSSRARVRPLHDATTADPSSSSCVRGNISKSRDNSNGVAAHGQVELKSLFDNGPVDHHRHHDPVTVARQIMPLLHLNDLGSLNERLREKFSSGGVSWERQRGHEQDGGGDDRSKREVVIGLPLQQQNQTMGKKKRESEDGKVDREPWSSKASGLLANTD